jgi:hypothetical protein
LKFRANEYILTYDNFNKDGKYGDKFASEGKEIVHLSGKCVEVWLMMIGALKRKDKLEFHGVALTIYPVLGARRVILPYVNMHFIEEKVLSLDGSSSQYDGIAKGSPASLQFNSNCQ